MAPPCGLTYSASSGTPSWRNTAMPCEANASLSSIRSKSVIFKPSRSISLRVDGTGPMPMMRGGSAVVDAGRIAGGDGAGIAHDGFELLQVFQRRVRPRMLVFIDDDGPRLAAWRLDRDDLLGEIAGGDGVGGALLRTQRKCILVLARDLEFLGDVLAGLGHGIDAVLRLHQRVDEAPAERGVVDVGRSRKRLAGLAHDERRPRHRFDSAGDGELHLA